MIIKNFSMNKNILFAFLAAFLFGTSTPLAKVIIGSNHFLVIAGLLYLGSGLGLSIVRLLRDKGWKPANMSKNDYLWFGGAIFFGGILGPNLLLFGLISTNASTASLLLNLEVVLTACLAWFVFKENFDTRIFLGMLFIVLSAILLSIPQDNNFSFSFLGPILISLSCLCWAIDNNLTRKISGSDALFIASVKGLVSGITNCSLAIIISVKFPSILMTISTMIIGLFGYGISIVLFILALRGLGAARTGAYFASAPFIGAIISIYFLSENISEYFWFASFLMLIGVWLHLTENHDHEHKHELMKHDHTHTHDEHHQHEHDFIWDGTEPHNHSHIHKEITHKHKHFPDIHHTHKH